MRLDGIEVAVMADEDAIKDYLAVFIAIVWAGAILASIITNRYEVLAAVTPVMTIVAGFLFGYRREGSKIDKRHNNQRDDDLSNW